MWVETEQVWFFEALPWPAAGFVVVMDQTGIAWPRIGNVSMFSINAMNKRNCSNTIMC